MTKKTKKSETMKKRIAGVLLAAAALIGTIALSAFPAFAAQEDTVLIISNADDWNAFAKSVLNGNTYTNCSVLLDTNIWTPVTSPVGNDSHPFSGTFYGKGHSIAVAIDSSSDNVGLFARLSGGEVNNLTVRGDVRGNNNVGGIAGTADQSADGEESRIINCVSDVNVSTKKKNTTCIGGVVGKASHTLVSGCILDEGKKILGLYNKSSVNACVGGIVGGTGSGYLTVEYCTVYGGSEDTVEGDGNGVGGVVGALYGKDGTGGSHSVVEGCVNHADVFNNDDNTGGIVGGSGKEDVISHCDNHGRIKTISYKNDNHRYNLGGVVGGLHNGSVAENCRNFGWVQMDTYKGHRVGGIVGYAANSEVTDCYAWGTVRTPSEGGGIVGLAVGAAVSGCTFEGTVSESAGEKTLSKNFFSDSGRGFGGIIGWSVNATVTGCVNEGTVGTIDEGFGSSTYAGGIIGCYEKSLTVEDCVNRGEVRGDTSVGGIIGAPSDGSTDNTRTVRGVVNEGAVTMEPSKDHGGLGGIAGLIHHLTLENAKNLADVDIGGAGTGANVGGIAGVSERSQIICVMNYGDVTGPGTNSGVVSKTGGIVGWMRGEALDNNNALLRCGNQGSVRGFGENVGAFIGLSDTGRAVWCLSCGTVSGDNASRYAYECAAVEKNDVSKAIRTVNSKMTGGPLWGTDSNGAPTIFFDGTGSEEDPYTIGTFDELRHLADNVNIGGLSYAGDHFRLSDDIVDNGTLSPIGSVEDGTAFEGNFDGDGHTVYLNMIQDAGTAAGLFGFVRGSVIKNLRTAGFVVGVKTGSESLSDTALSSVTAAAGICAAAENAHFINCQNDANVQGTNAGGIVGMITNVTSGSAGSSASFGSASVNNCVNRGEILGAMTAGGIAGRAVRSAFSRCVNLGEPKPLYVGQKPEEDPPCGQIIGWGYDVPDTSGISNKTLRTLAGWAASSAGRLTVTDCYSLAGTADDVLCGNFSGEESCGIFEADESEFSFVTDAVNNAGDGEPFRGEYKAMTVTENSIGFSMFPHTHDRPETVYYQVDPGIGFSGHSTYYGCNTCGTLYTDEEMTSEANPFLLMILTTLEENEDGTPATRLDRDVFFTSDEVREYIAKNPSREYTYISLGFDIETTVPVRYKSDLTVELNGYKWLYSGEEDSSVFSDETSQTAPRTLTVSGGGEDGRGTIEIYEFCTCRLLGNMNYTTKISISDTDIVNTGASGDGGMIETGDSLEKAPELILENVTVTGSHSGGSGGAIFIASPAESGLPGTIRLNGVLFEKCGALENGGAICIRDAAVSIVGDGDSRFKLCNAGMTGGAVFIDLSEGDAEIIENECEAGIRDLTFTGNYTGRSGNFTTAKRGSKIGNGGGAVYCCGDGYEISGCIFQNNLSASAGGAVCAPCEAEISDCDFVDNMALGFGYDIYLASGYLGDLTVQNTKASFDDDLWVYQKSETERTVKICVEDSETVVEDVSFADGVVGSAVAEGRVLFVLIAGGAAVILAVIFIVYGKRKKKKS